MVNTGRPSPACKACRARRLKCDQTKPACNKCARAGRVCPGYREAFEINFKDQTDLTIRKHERSNSITKDTTPKYRRGHKRSHSSSSEDSVTSISSGIPEETTLFQPVTWFPPPGNLLRFETPVADQASCYFVANFVCLKSHGAGASLQFLWPLIKAAMQNDTFNSAFEAASMAAIASRPNSGALVPLARTYYDKALKQVSRTVQDREKAKEDQSLAAIIMLIIYEVLMWDDARSNLDFHVQGAQAMIKLRASTQKHSRLGQAMFEFICSFIIHKYAHSHDLSEEYEDMMWWAMEGSGDDGPKQAIRRLTIETTVLRRQVGDFFNTNPAKIEFPTAIRLYKKAKALDLEIGRWFQEGPHLRMRRIDRWQEDVADHDIHRALAYPGKVYEFDNIFIGAKFLSLHLHRLYMAEIMLQISTWIEACGACLSSGCTERYEAIELAKQEISEIIAIVPFYCKGQDTESPSPFGGMTCSFPIYVTGSSSVVTKRQKAYLAGRLSHLSEATGLKIAGKLADVLRN